MQAVRPREMTREQERKAVQWLTENCDLAELRRRQELTEQQLEQAHRYGLTEALENLRAMEDHLQEAVARK